MLCSASNSPVGGTFKPTAGNLSNIVEVTHSTDMEDVHGKRIAFSATTEEISRKGSSEEGLHQHDYGKALDRRSYIDFKDDTSRAISNSWCVQIEGRLPDGTPYTGSGTLRARNGIQYILTCAHNVVAVPWKGDYRPYTDITCYWMRIGDDVYVWKLRVTKIVVHPKHDDTPNSGFDLAVLFFEDLPGKNYTTDYYSTKPEIRNSGWPTSTEENLRATLKGKTVSVVGYPGEKVPPAFQSSWVGSLLGYAATPGRYTYGHSGPVTEVSETKGGGYVLSYGVDTTPGNSGSPISVHLEETVDVYGKKMPKMGIIGIHTGSNQGLGTNFGTLITSDLRKWIHSEVDKHGLEKKKDESAHA